VRRTFIVVLFLLLAACSSSGSSGTTGAPPTGISFILPVKWTDTSTPTVTPTFTPTSTETPTPTSPPLPTNTDKPLANGMGAHPPSDGELKDVPSIWTLARYRELMSPGTADYAATIKAGSMWIWDWSFCAVKGNFISFIDSVEIQFLLDGETLREGEHLRVADGSGRSGWLCRRWWTVLSGWPRNRSVRLDIGWTNLVEADDGVTDYPAGQYDQLIIVIAE
jgi:hypothetical protein